MNDGTTCFAGRPVTDATPPTYRAALAVVRPPPAPYTKCPECGHEQKICDRKNCVRVGEVGSRCRSFGCMGAHVHGHPLPLPLSRVCSPRRRLRGGFLWLRRCREPGVHCHQSCPRCLWAEVVLPPGMVRP